jgi:hypothetical protein
MYRAVYWLKEYFQTSSVKGALSILQSVSLGSLVTCKLWSSDTGYR